MTALEPVAWREPTSLLPLRWGGYRERLVIGTWCIISGSVAVAGSDTYILLLLYAGAIVNIAGWCILPSDGWRRVVAVGPSVLSSWLLLTGNPHFLVVLVMPYLGWLLVRHRPLRSYVTVIIPLGVAILLGEVLPPIGGLPLGIAIEVAAMVAGAWLARILAQTVQTRVA